MSDSPFSQKAFDPIAATQDELTAWLVASAHAANLGAKLFQWIHQRSVADPDLMKNLPESLKHFLKESSLAWPATIGEVQTSVDGTRKMQILLCDGSTVETVLIPEDGKLTQCISSQVGCAVGCLFCRSGKFGLKRNLSVGEILAQVHLAKAHYYPGEWLRNVVYMGVGEPLHNADAVIRSVSLLCDAKGLNLSTRRVTVSTAGVIKGLQKLADAGQGQITLAISLHAADDETRKKLVPGIRDSLDDLMVALKNYPLPKRRRIIVEYVLVKDVNDADHDARALAKLLSSLPCKVNLLPLNAHDGTELLPPDEQRVLAFQHLLLENGISAFFRKRRGEDIGAACGQLLSFKKTTH